MVAVSIRRHELDAAGLRRAASRSQDADAARRMLALALVVEGCRQDETARPSLRSILSKRSNGTAPVAQPAAGFT